MENSKVNTAMLKEKALKRMLFKKILREKKFYIALAITCFAFLIRIISKHYNIPGAIEASNFIALYCIIALLSIIHKVIIEYLDKKRITGTKTQNEIKEQFTKAVISNKVALFWQFSIFIGFFGWAFSYMDLYNP